MTNKPIVFIVLLFIFVISLPGKAQTPVHKIYNVDNFLSSNETYQVAQNREGYIYCATELGLLRFDGNGFKTIPLKDGLESTVSIYKIQADHEGELLGEVPGRGLYRLKQDTLYSLPENDIHKSFRYTSFITNFLSDSLGRVWMKYRPWFGEILIRQVSGRIDTLSPRMLVNYKKMEIDLDCYRVPGSNRYLCVGNISDPGKAIAINKRVEATSFGWKIHKLNTIKGIKNIFRSAPALQTKRFLWLTYSNLIIRKDLRNGQEESFKCSDEIYSLTALENDRLAVCTEEGLYVFNGESMSPEHWFKKYRISHCFEDRENGIWLSTLNGGIIYIPSIHVRKLDAPEFRNKIKVLTKHRNTIYALSSEGKLGIFRKKNVRIHDINHTVKPRHATDMLVWNNTLYIDRFAYDLKQKSIKEVVGVGITRLRKTDQHLLLISVGRAFKKTNDGILDTVFGLGKRYRFLDLIPNQSGYLSASFQGVLRPLGSSFLM